MKKSFIKILSRLMALAILFSLLATAIGCVKDDPVINSQPPVETTVTLDSQVKNMTVGDSTILNFTFTGEENLQTSWSSSDENVAKVIDGRVEAISEGTTTVTMQPIHLMTTHSPLQTASLMQLLLRIKHLVNIMTYLQLQTAKLTP